MGFLDKLTLGPSGSGAGGLNSGNTKTQVTQTSTTTQNNNVQGNGGPVVAGAAGPVTINYSDLGAINDSFEAIAKAIDFGQYAVKSQENVALNTLGTATDLTKATLASNGDVVNLALNASAQETTTFGQLLASLTGQEVTANAQQTSDLAKALASLTGQQIAATANQNSQALAFASNAAKPDAGAFQDSVTKIAWVIGVGIVTVGLIYLMKGSK